MSDETFVIDGVKINPKDVQKYWRQRPDPGFSVARNRTIINEVIKANEEARIRLRNESIEGIRERANAVAHFLKYKDRGGGNDVVQYLGRRNLAELRGQQIIQTLKRRADGTKYIELGDVNNAQKK